LHAQHRLKVASTSAHKTIFYWGRMRAEAVGPLWCQTAVGHVQLWVCRTDSRQTLLHVSRYFLGSVATSREDVGHDAKRHLRDGVGELFPAANGAGCRCPEPRTPSGQGCARGPAEVKISHDSAAAFSLAERRLTRNATTARDCSTAAELHRAPGGCWSQVTTASSRQGMPAIRKSHADVIPRAVRCPGSFGYGRERHNSRSG
jgi:hypothetical protein